MREDQAERWLHYVMSLTGGFLGGYAILNRSGLLGAAQTSNMINTILNLAGGSFSGLAIRLGALVLYVSGIVTTVLIPRCTRWNLKNVSLALDVAAVLVLGFLPQGMDNMLALYPLFFAMSVQWCTFQGCGGYASATVFSTNNLRQFATAVTAFYFGREEKMREKIKFYGATLTAFHLGVAASGPCCNLAGVKSVWICLAPLAAAGYLAAAGRREESVKICECRGEGGNVRGLAG